MTRKERLYIRYQPSRKGSSQVQLPLPWKFMLEVADLPVDAPACLLTEKGTPFASSGSLDTSVGKWIIAAGLGEPVLDGEGNALLDGDGKPGVRATRSLHGFRTRRAAQIAEASGSVFEVMGADVAQRSGDGRDLHQAGGPRASCRACGAARRGGRRGAQCPTARNRGELDDVTPDKTTENQGEWQPVGESNPSFQVENLAS